MPNKKGETIPTDYERLDTVQHAVINVANALIASGYLAIEASDQKVENYQHRDTVEFRPQNPIYAQSSLDNLLEIAMREIENEDQ